MLSLQLRVLGFGLLQDRDEGGKGLSGNSISNAAMLVWKKRICIFRLEEGRHSR